LRVAKLALEAADTAEARTALDRQLLIWQRADSTLPDYREARRLAEALRRD
jgi:hypothetical protein